MPSFVLSKGCLAYLSKQPMIGFSDLPDLQLSTPAMFIRWGRTARSKDRSAKLAANPPKFEAIDVPPGLNRPDHGPTQVRQLPDRL